MGLGSLRVITLAEARDTPVQHHRLVPQGGDPRVERSHIQAAAAAASDVMTFQKAAEIYTETKRHGWRKKHADQWTNTITAYANRVIGRLSCADVTTELVLEILKPIWTTKNETATRLRGRIENIMDWAVVSGHRTGDNPAIWKGNLAHLLPSISKRQRVKHQAAMPYAEVPALFQAIEVLKSINRVEGSPWVFDSRGNGKPL